MGVDINFVQDNHSYSRYGVIRGLHYQVPPFEQAKLVRVIKGEVFDIALDLRKESQSYGRWVSEYLSEYNRKQIWIPEGFAHGFIALSDETELIYKVTKEYEPGSEISIKWNDESLMIDWPKTDKIILSDRDLNAMSFARFKELF